MFLNRFMDFSHTYFTKKLSRLKTFLFPCPCLLCGTAEASFANLCTDCRKSLPILTQHCLRCAQILPGRQDGFATLICGYCLKNPPDFCETYALFPYEPPVSNMLIRLKFNHDLLVAETLGRLLAETIKKKWYLEKPLPDLILPVPLHPRRLKERGFNQAIEIGRPLSKRLNRKLDLLGLKRLKYTKPQSGLKSAERNKNLKDAFFATRHYQNMTIAILDDVITTTSTIREVSTTLKAAGAKAIHVWCCARR